MKFFIAFLSMVSVSSAFASMNCNWVAKKSAARYVLKNYDEGPVTIHPTSKCSPTTYFVTIETAKLSHYFKVRTHLDHKFGVCRIVEMEEVQANDCRSPKH